MSLTSGPKMLVHRRLRLAMTAALGYTCGFITSNQVVVPLCCRLII
jgi:hypothetical protein